MGKQSLGRRVLIVDDKLENRRKYADLVLNGAGHSTEKAPRPQAPRIRPTVGVACDAEEALAALRAAREMGEPFDVLVTDFIMPPHNGLWLIEQLRRYAFDPESLDVVLVSQQEEVHLKREEIEEAERKWRGPSSREMSIVLRAEVIDQAPAVNQQSAEAHEAEFLEAVWRGIWTKLEESAYRELRAAYPSEIQDDGGWRKLFITRDANLVTKIEELLRYAAPTPVPILILGPRGTGKNELAKLIHARSPRRDKPFIKIDPATLAVFESQVFGHVQGAFSGAIRDHKGLIELAEGGTLFIDEIGEFPAEFQIKLLGVLQDKVIRPIGAIKATRIDFRLIVATNIDLEVALREGTLRPDLYDRINEESITLPSLQHRRDDVPALITHFWSCQTEEGGAGRTEEWELAALTLLSTKDWPGNIRELQSYIGRLRRRHPQGEMVSVAALQSPETSPDYFFGLEDLDTAVVRSRHIMFYPALVRRHNTAADATSETWASEAFYREVIQEWGLHFGDTSHMSALRQTIQTAWTEHRRLCAVCAALWREQRR